MRKTLFIALFTISLNIYASTTFNSDGSTSESMQNADGSISTFNSDGTTSTTQKDANGSITTFNSDGTSSTTFN